MRNFKIIYKKLKLSHHRFNNILIYLNWMFKGINFNSKKVLDIGGGRGLCSYYSMFRGAYSCINLEPFLDGSSGEFLKNNINDLKVEYINSTFQKFDTKEKFDIIIIHDTINHIDEEQYIELRKSKKARKIYSELIKKISQMLNKDGVIVVSDCASSNFYGNLGIKNPFAPSIEWKLHQNPSILIPFFEHNNLKVVSKRWSPFKRFGYFGLIISFFGFLPSFFMQSHFCLVFKK